MGGDVGQRIAEVVDRKSLRIGIGRAAGRSLAEASGTRTGGSGKRAGAFRAAS